MKLNLPIVVRGDKKDFFHKCTCPFKIDLLKKRGGNDHKIVYTSMKPSNNIFFKN